MEKVAVTSKGRLEFRCLGPVSLTGPEGGKLGFRTRKQAALLLLLALRSGRPIPREHLLELLWSEDEPERARHSLSQSVSLINKTFGTEAVAPASKDQIQLRPGLMWLDVAAFEQCVAAERLDEARALWRGGLLEGLWIQRAPNFERWLEGERQRLVRAMRRVLRGLVETHRAEGDWEAMRATAESQLELDGLDEAAMLACLEGLVLHGDRTLALRRYREFEARLKEELDAEPGAALRDWAKRQKRGDAAGSGAASRAIPRVSETGALPTAGPVFGRTAEFAELWQAWETARTGQGGGCIILQGPPGIGKTALAGKLVNQVHVAGGSACFVKCFKSEKSVPFAPVTALLRQLSRLPGFVALGEVWIGELTRLVPELRERYPSVPQPMAVDDSARHRLCDAALQATECVADEHPLLLVVDDIQDADEATLALLHYLGRQVPTQPTLLLYVARVPGEETELQRTFFETARSAGFARFIQLGALEDPEVARLVKQVLAQRGLDAPDDALATLAQVARGNPLHAIELAMAIPGRDGRAATEWLQTLHQQPGGEEGFERTATERLAALSAEARAVASVLAIAGRPLSGYEVAAVTGLPVAELATAIAALESAQFLRRGGASVGFAHEEYVQTVEATINERERRAIHLKLAKLLAKSAAQNPAARYEVARHYEGAKRFREACSHAVAASRYAGSVGAIRERAAALQLAKRVSRERDGQLAADLGASFLALKEFEHLGQLCWEVRQSETVSDSVAADFRFFEIAAAHDSGSASLSSVKRDLAALLAPDGPGFSQELNAQLLLMRTADRTGDPEEARSISKRLRRRARGAKDERLRTYALYAAAFIFAKYYKPARALPILELIIRRAQVDHDWGLEHLARSVIGAVLRQLGRYRECRAQTEYGLALARKTLDPQAESNSLMDLGVVSMATGDFEQAARMLNQAEAAIAERLPKGPNQAYIHSNLGVLHIFVDEPGIARSHYQAALNYAESLGVWRMEAVSLGGLGLCAKRLSDLDGLGRSCERLRGLIADRRSAIADRALVEIALAWDTALNSGRGDDAVADLTAATRELRERDVDHWLHVWYELVTLKEFLSGHTATDERRRLIEAGRLFEAKRYARIPL